MTRLSAILLAWRCAQYKAAKPPAMITIDAAIVGPSGMNAVICAAGTAMTPRSVHPQCAWKSSIAQVAISVAPVVTIPAPRIQRPAADHCNPRHRASDNHRHRIAYQR